MSIHLQSLFKIKNIRERIIVRLHQILSKIWIMECKTCEMKPAALMTSHYIAGLVRIALPYGALKFYVMSNAQTRKSCVVPRCTANTTNSPEKLFFMVPMECTMRQKWIKAMRRLEAFSPNSTVYCCEDHFDVETDMENYIKYKLVGGRIKLKKGTIPHKFECQEENFVRPERSVVYRRSQVKYFEETLQRQNNQKDEDVTELDLTAVPERVSIICGDSLERQSFENKEVLYIPTKDMAVQVKLRRKVCNKSTMTEEKYLKKQQ